MSNSIKFFKDTKIQQKLNNKIKQLITFNYDINTKNDTQNQFQTKYLIEGLQDPFFDMMNRPSKFIRPTICLLLGDALNLKEQNDNIITTAAFIEVIHNNTLMLDDVYDQSQIRRGQPCVHLIYGEDTSINSSVFYQFNLPFHLCKLMNIENPIDQMKIQQLYFNCITDLYKGVTLDVQWHKNRSLQNLPNEFTFYQMLKWKTSRLMYFSLEILDLFYELKKNDMQILQSSLEDFGVAFQINDDMINLFSEEYFKSKGMAEDLHEKKFSFPVFQFFKQENDVQKKKQFLKVFNKDNKKDDDIMYLIDILNNKQIIDSAQQQIQQLTNNYQNKLLRNFGNKNQGINQLLELFQLMLQNKFLKVQLILLFNILKITKIKDFILNQFSRNLFIKELY